MDSREGMMTATIRWQCRLVLVLVLMWAPAAQAGPITFTLQPGAEISGPPGATIGWGYEIRNESGFWLEFVGFGGASFADVTSTEFLFDFEPLAAGTSRTKLFSAFSEGFFQITWDPLAPVGSQNGTFELFAQLWTGDPLDPTSAFDSDITLSANYLATVTGPAQVPEPATLLLFASGLGATGWLERRRRARSSTSRR